ncbi:thiamine pyrophosphate-dependent enzyme [Marinobacter sp. M3C]|uniref:alpha-ketoacid dehydrogenase subunit alpha/beta n=1 Tax=unclassified Marinobacter TaxID=83889 RepID=UPI00200FA87E|nr:MULTISPECIES: alpha-ketoacid dehydrogenase subunit alpha/beta [unclassified Marinobacter]MCL1476228.1 thiamine pyrophosphate-dependent enzyme [Marinobacter sp.]MCL1488797.1 thiamine pyrophosphate-dependent enzyme [Marinobacter sp.]UQG58120.1 thiamine pyrophosphate-dependent enzyme [Marinobacter sp. M4C]UQG60582.1 thiamine pyrophosphate-dependent enzyme [Marinobacter sp. M3C]UQG66925.1 thiamine pyrophosphate-dependent enzyme [Marinobacter sp. M2C]
MMKIKNISIDTPMLEMELESGDWSGFSADNAKRMATLFLSARRFEESILKLDKLSLVHGPAHSSIGQEGGAAGCLAALPRQTMINGTHRAHHQCVAKAVHARYPDDFDPATADALPAEMSAEISQMMAEILGLSTGWTGGRGGSMHLRREEVGIMGTNAIVAGGLPLACGHAFAEKVRGGDSVMVSFFGDGAIHQGAAQEAMALAALYQLPLIFFLENNRYAVSTSVEQSCHQTDLLTRPFAHGIPSMRVDGMNPLAVWHATKWAHKCVREQGGPAFIQADVYRYFHQSSAIPGSAFGYRSKEEEEIWRARDPYDFLRTEFANRELLSHDDFDAIDLIVSKAVNAAYDHCIEGKGSASRIRAELWPDPHTVDHELTGDLAEFQDVSFSEVTDFAAEELQEMTLIQAMSQVVGARMREDDSIYVFGEDVANMGGGTVGATKGLPAEFPDRIINTPITENGFCGLAAGAAVSGLKPIVELMYSDFILVAGDQLLNQAGKMRHLFGGRLSVPLVLRSRVPGLEGYGSQHSMDPAGLFALFPGWRILAPSNPYDYVGLMNSALRCQDPVLIIEAQELHKKSALVPKSLDYYIPIGRAHKVAEGDQITLLATLTMVEMCQKIATKMGVRADIIDLRTLSLRDIDYDTIGDSVRKTGKVAIVEQTTRGASIGAHIADEIQRKFFDYLDQPVKRVTGRWSPPTVSKVLEEAALANGHDVEAGISDLLADSGLSA